METQYYTKTYQEIEWLAEQYANQLISRLQDINAKYPSARLDQNDKENVDRDFNGQIPGPGPIDAIQAFRESFFTYMASRYIIVPGRE